ncbi:MAG: SAM-dependent methyltransferase, partial [Actinomycetota bacterium]
MIWPADLNAPRARALEAELTGADPLAAISAVRRAHPEIDPALVSALATQARLRARARPRLHPWADDLVLSDAGLQQASRSAVALYRGAELTRRLG